MGKYIIGILVCVALVFNLYGIRGEVMQESIIKVSAQESHAQNNFDPSDTDCTLTSTDSQSALDIFNSTICDLFFSASSLPNGVNVPKNLKFASSIVGHVTTTSSVLANHSGHSGYHSDFVKSPRRYFVYTLRRLLI